MANSQVISLREYNSKVQIVREARLHEGPTLKIYHDIYSLIDSANRLLPNGDEPAREGLKKFVTIYEKTKAKLMCTLSIISAEAAKLVYQIQRTTRSGLDDHGKKAIIAISKVLNVDLVKDLEDFNKVVNDDTDTVVSMLTSYGGGHTLKRLNDQKNALLKEITDKSRVKKDIEQEIRDQEANIRSLNREIASAAPGTDVPSLQRKADDLQLVINYQAKTVETLTGQLDDLEGRVRGLSQSIKNTLDSMHLTNIESVAAIEDLFCGVMRFKQWLLQVHTSVETRLRILTITDNIGDLLDCVEPSLHLLLISDELRDTQLFASLLNNLTFP